MALCGYIAAQRGLLDFDGPVGELWPEFAVNGKEDTTIRDLFTHRSGLVVLDTDLTLQDFGDWTPVIRAIETQRPMYSASRRQLMLALISARRCRSGCDAVQALQRQFCVGVKYCPPRYRLRGCRECLACWTLFTTVHCYRSTCQRRERSGRG